ncbi:MAG: hypothetical protein M3N51_07085 [Actinomycetota bacterium]|nr:hypothetical protein [Actinomycetota bacterium]
MLLPDVNVLVYANKEGTARHAEYREWLESVLSPHRAFGISELVLSGFVRVVTIPASSILPRLSSRRSSSPS